jgi:hypothetical protein
MKQMLQLHYWRAHLTLGTGAFNGRSPLDDDTVEITTYHYVETSAVNNIIINTTAFLASSMKPMPISIKLTGNRVSFQH